MLHTWGSALTHHPHIHMIVPGGGISLDGKRWVSSRPAFLLPVRVLGSLFRRLFLTRLLELHTTGKLQFFGKQAELTDAAAFRQRVALVRKKTWVVYAKPPFAGPAAVLAYLSRYTHRVAISEPSDHCPPCPCSGGNMIVVMETFMRCTQPRAPPEPPQSAGRTTS